MVIYIFQTLNAPAYYIMLASRTK